MSEMSSGWNAAPVRNPGVWLAVVFAFALWIPFRHFTVDDAFIAYRHAVHFGAGLGPVMNPGERVEGVSNLPWTLLLGALSALGLAPHRAAPVLSLVCSLACIPLAARFAARASADRSAPVVAAWLTAAGVPLVIWSASGMETTTYALVILCFATTCSDAVRRGAAWWKAGLAGGVAAALRPEGLLLVGCGAAAALWAARDRRRALVGFALGLAALLVPLVLFRIFYFGDWLPNPARAKSPAGLAGLAPGALYAAKLAISFPIAVVSLALLWRRVWLEPAAAITLAIVAGQVVFIVLAGGDHFAGYRFAAPVWPLAASAMAWMLVGSPRPIGRAATIALVVVGAAGLVATLWPRAALPLAMQLARLQRLQLPPAEHALRLASELRHAGVALLVLCVWVAVERRWGSAPRRVALRTAALVLATLLPATLDPQIRVCRQADAASRYGRPVGEWLATALPPGSLVATNAAGSIPYWSRLPVLDMLGLTDRHLARSRSDVHSWIGHERGDAAYVLQRRPAIVIWGGPEGSPEPGPFPGDHQLAASAEFHAAYEIERVPLAAFDFTYWRRRDRDSTPSAPGL